MDVIAGLDAFRGVARAGSFTAAATALGLPQPVVSRRVAALEAELGVQLFERSTRTVMITEAGHRILPRAEETLDQLDRIRQLARGEMGHLIMAIPAGISPRALAAVRRGAPNSVVFEEGTPAARLDRWSNGAAAALVPTDEEHSDIRLGLGVAGVDLDGSAFRLRQLRRSRGERGERPRVLQIGVEDDMPGVGDPLRRAAWSVGLRRDQLLFSAPAGESVVRAHERGDLLLATRREAGTVELDWLPLADLDLARHLRLLTTLDFCPDEQRHLLVERLRRGLTE
ncbi:MAG: LysR family transcriptional regulator [Propionibacteriales bacterium]|nr:LysR family transcriptional regulator [Propionibacteriales bacterium]